MAAWLGAEGSGGHHLLWNPAEQTLASSGEGLNWAASHSPRLGAASGAAGTYTPLGRPDVSGQ